MTDAKTSVPIFEIPGVRPFAHLEFAKGIVVFDTGNGTSTTPSTSCPALWSDANRQNLRWRSGDHSKLSTDHHVRRPMLAHRFRQQCDRIPTLRLPAKPVRFLVDIWPSTERSSRLPRVSHSARESIMRVSKARRGRCWVQLARRRCTSSIWRKKGRSRSSRRT